MVEIDKDKKYLGEDCFTLADLVELVLSKFNHNNKSRINNTSKLPKDSKFPVNSTPEAQAQF